MSSSRMEEHITELRNAEFFVSIRDEEKSNLFYGGNQDWFKRKIAQQGGCGPTAAANILAYYAENHPDTMGVLYRYNVNRITKTDFTEHMEQVYKYVKPIEIYILLSRKLNIQFKTTIGVPTASRFINGVTRYSKNRGVKLVGHSINESIPYEEAIKYIEEALTMNYPIALLMWENSNLPSYDMHWMTITRLIVDSLTGKVYVDVSTWGEKRRIDFDLIWNSNDYWPLNRRNLVYFEIM